MSTDADVTKAEQNRVQRYIDARADLAKAEAEVKKLKERVERAEAAVLDLYVENGWQNVKCNGRRVSLVKRVFARPVPDHRDALIAALRSEGYEDLVQTNVLPATLSAFVREHQKEGDPIPESIAEHLIVTELFGLSMAKQ